MVVGSVRIVVSLSGVRSLKEKRKIVHSVRDRAKAKFNASVGEVADHDIYQKATFGVAVVSNEVAHADSQLQNIITFFAENSDVVDVSTEIVTR